MGQSLVQIYLHIVFSTKNRKPFLQQHEARERVYAYLAETSNNLGCPAVKSGGVEDHVHLLVRFGKSIEISRLIRELKRSSSEWVKSEVKIRQSRRASSNSHISRRVSAVVSEERDRDR